MKKTLIALGLAVSFLSLTAFANIPPEGAAKFLGNTACKACHSMPKTGAQYKVWETSSHAKALKTLQTPEADKIAAGKGIKTKAADAPECLSCHAPGVKEDGVGCESCHGAGENYKTKHQKPDQKAGVAALGMKLPNVADGSAEKLCKTCHNDKSPTHKAFKFDEHWKKIAHPLPKG